MPKGQSIDVQRKRLSEGCCPIHGLGMSQIDGWYYPKDGRGFTVVACSRRDCQLAALAYYSTGDDHLSCEFFTHYRETVASHQSEGHRLMKIPASDGRVPAEFENLDSLHAMHVEHWERHVRKSRALISALVRGHKLGTKRAEWIM